MTKRINDPYVHGIKPHPATGAGPYEVTDKYGATVDRVATLGEALASKAKYDAKELAREF